MTRRLGRRLRWTVEATGWRYTRRWIVGLRRGEWWIGFRYSLEVDCWEFNAFGLTVLVPIEGTPRRTCAGTRPQEVTRV